MSPQFPLDRRLGGPQNHLDNIENRKIFPSIMNQNATFIPYAHSLVVVNVKQNLKKLTFFIIKEMMKCRILFAIYAMRVEVNEEY
jgi:hypothetical protein